MPALAIAQNKAIKFLATQGYATSLVKPQGDDRLEIPETLLTDRDPAGEPIWIDINTSFTYSGWFNLYDWYQFSKTNGSGLLMIGQRVHANNNPSLGLMVLRPADYSTSNKRGNGGILKLLCADTSNSSVAGDITGDNALINLDEWFYLTLVYDKDAQEVRVYKDGNRIMTRTLSNPLRLLPDVPGILYTGSFAMNGMCDELQFWTKALTDAEVQTAYYSANEVSGLDLWYDFNEATESESGEQSTFLNKATSEKGQGINATYYHCAAAKTSYAGYITNIATFTEKTPELVEGREIQTLPSCTITIPEVTNGTLMVTNGTETLTQGDNSVTLGSSLTVTATPAEGYALVKLKYAGEYITSGSSVSAIEDAAIEVEFTNIFHTITIADTEATYTLTALNGSEIDRKSVPQGTEIKLTITEWPTEKTLKQVSLNNEVLEATEDGSYIFSMNADSNLNIELRALENFTITYKTNIANGTLAVTDALGGTIASGATALEGSTIKIEALPASGYDIMRLCANGEDIESGSQITVTDNITIECEFAEAVAYVPGYQKNGGSNHHYSLRFSESVLGDRESNTCDDPAEVGTTDHRSRNFTYSVWIKPTAETARPGSKEPHGRLMGDIQEGMTGTDGAFSVAVEDGKLVLRSRVYKTATDMPGLTELVTDTEMAMNEWAFLSVVSDNEAKTLTLYKNGLLCGSLDTSKDNEGNEAYGIGLLPDASSFYVFDFTCAGYVEEAQVWTKALTQDEIKRSTRIGKHTDGLVALFRPRKGNQIMTNYGSATDVTAALYAGFYTSGKWTTPKEQVIFDAGPAHNPERVNVTLAQPSDNIGTFTVIGEEGRSIEGNAYLYEPLNVDLSNISGATVTGISVTCNGETTNYTLEQLPFIADGDVEISLNYEVINTIMFSYTGEHGKITLKVNDEEPIEVTEPIAIPKNSTLVITAIPDDHYELTKAFINGDKIYDLSEVEDGVGDESFLNNEYTYQAGVRNVDLELTFDLVRFYLFTEVVNNNGQEIAGDDTDLYPAFSDTEGNTIDENDPTFVEVPYGTEVSLSIWSVSPDSYETDGDHNILHAVWDYEIDNTTGDYLPAVNVIDKLETIESGNSEDRIYHLGAITSSHYIFVFQDLLSGIATIGADANSPVKVVDGIITIGEEALIEVTDMSGRTVARTTGVELNVKDIVKGIYVAKVTTESQVYTLKFIKF